MRYRPLRCAATAIFVATATGLVLAAGARSNPGDKPSAKPAVVAGRRSASVMGAAWNADNTPLKGARLRLRNVLSGQIEAAAVANDAGQFAFDGVEGGTYVVELVNEGGKILAIGHPFTISAGETVATFVRLSTRAPWVQGFFSNAAAAVIATAASEGITALAPVARPVSAGR